MSSRYAIQSVLRFIYVYLCIYNGVRIVANNELAIRETVLTLNVRLGTEGDLLREKYCY